jgi:hypothetical protein
MLEQLDRLTTKKRLRRPKKLKVLPQRSSPPTRCCSTAALFVDEAKPEGRRVVYPSEVIMQGSEWIFEGKRSRRMPDSLARTSQVRFSHTG